MTESSAHEPAVEAAHDQWHEQVMALLQRLADEFEGTDAPAGIEAHRLLQNGQFIDAVRRDPTLLLSHEAIEASTEEAS